MMRSFPALIAVLLTGLALLAACQSLDPSAVRPEPPAPAEDGYLPGETPIRPLAAD
ncbi:hypothetical protein ACLB6G_00770 [Zhengella sp. ZM62]|uniref:hypothetical protein n=1 Tax=Zhengella sedimenti TaxID=3390035 RepID=UPI003975027A